MFHRFSEDLDTVWTSGQTADGPLGSFYRRCLTPMDQPPKLGCVHPVFLHQGERIDRPGPAWTELENSAYRATKVHRAHVQTEMVWAIR
jgi:hypothetical protein